MLEIDIETATRWYAVINEARSNDSSLIDTELGKIATWLFEQVGYEICDHPQTVHEYLFIRAGENLQKEKTK
jgi:hypothetical protein